MPRIRKNKGIPMIKVELHAHCKGGSGCAFVPAKDLIREYKDAGYNGIVLTNHICESEFNKYPGETRKEKLDFYFSLYEDTKREGEKQGLKVFLGAEIRAKEDYFIEFMIYGFEKELLYNSTDLFTLNQKELFEFCEKNGIFMYQTHPFRRGVTCGDPKYLHGAEAFNGHVNHVNNNAQANEFCEKNGLIKLCGTDFHDPNQPKTSYALIPDDVNTEKELADYIRSGKLQIFGDEETYQARSKRK